MKMSSVSEWHKWLKAAHLSKIEMKAMRKKSGLYLNCSHIMSYRSTERH
jgi:hypothetical protein